MMTPEKVTENFRQTRRVLVRFIVLGWVIPILTAIIVYVAVLPSEPRLPLFAKVLLPILYMAFTGSYYLQDLQFYVFYARMIRRGLAGDYAILVNELERLRSLKNQRDEAEERLKGMDEYSYFVLKKDAQAKRDKLADEINDRGWGLKARQEDFERRMQGWCFWLYEDLIPRRF